MYFVDGICRYCLMLENATRLAHIWYAMFLFSFSAFGLSAVIVRQTIR